MRAYEQSLARIWPAAHALKLGGALAWAVMTLPGLQLDYWSAGDVPARRKLREAALADLPDNWLTRPARADLLYGVGVLRWREGDAAGAADAYRQTLTLAEQLRHKARVADCCFWLGEMYRAQGRYDEARAAYTRTLEVSPRFHHAHTALGHALARQERYEEALAAYQQAIDLYPHDAEPHVGVGHVYLRLGRLADAVVAYQWAIDAAPDRPYPYVYLGVVLHRLKRYAEAETALRRGIELAPGEPDPYEMLGDVYASQSQAAQALTAYQQAVDRQADPHKRAVLRLSVGAAQQKLGQYEAALDTYHQALAAMPELMPAHLESGACLRRLGREADAVGPLQAARRLIAKDDAYSRACLESVCGHADEALTWLKKALERESGRRAQALVDPDFDFIRETAGFCALIGRETSEVSET